MTLPLLATVPDLEDRVGDIASDDLPNALSLLRYASNLVRAYGNRTWDEEPTPEQLTDVVVGMVERAVTNKEGATQETAGPFTVSWGAAAAQRVYLTVGDKRIIRSVGGGGAFTVAQGVGQPQGTLGGWHDDWLP